MEGRIARSIAPVGMGPRLCGRGPGGGRVGAFFGGRRLPRLVSRLRNSDIFFFPFSLFRVFEISVLWTLDYDFEKERLKI
jgi:hypothetical protein